MKILTVDDKPDHLLVLETKLKAAGFSVDSAPDGIEALRKLRAQRFDLVITDLMMSEMDGYQLTHAIKTDDELKTIPVLVYTATYTDPKDETLALNLGANGFIVKPATDELFFAEVRRLVEQAAHQALPQRTPTSEELTYLRQYTERLVRKLQDKVQELEHTKAKLREWTATLESRVKEATAELRRTNEELEAFAYSVSHDLRSPLRSIEGFVTAVISRSPPLPEAERQRLLQRAATLAVQGQLLINDLLEYARLKSVDLTLSPVPLSQAVALAIEQLEPAQRAKAQIDVGPLRSRVLAHQPTLVEVIENLLANAIKFVKPAATPHVAITEAQRDSWVQLAVADNGIGIPQEYHQRIFKVFERLHDNSTYPGTGIGLAIVQRAIQKMHGRVGVDSHPSGGSIFWIEMPKTQ